MTIRSWASGHRLSLMHGKLFTQSFQHLNATHHTYVQMVLDRPGNALTGTLTDSLATATTRQEALETYLIESGKEFAGEYNGRWSELRRTKMLEYMLEKYNYDVKKIGALDFNTYKLRPIPLDAITLNEGIDEEDQNPGYANN